MPGPSRPTAWPPSRGSAPGPGSHRGRQQLDPEPVAVELDRMDRLRSTLRPGSCPGPRPGPPRSVAIVSWFSPDGLRVERRTMVNCSTASGSCRVVGAAAGAVGRPEGSGRPRRASSGAGRPASAPRWPPWLRARMPASTSSSSPSIPSSTQRASGQSHVQGSPPGLPWLLAGGQPPARPACAAGGRSPRGVLGPPRPAGTRWRLPGRRCWPRRRCRGDQRATENAQSVRMADQPELTGYLGPLARRRSRPGRLRQVGQQRRVRPRC